MQKGQRTAAGRIFARYSSLPARIGAAFAAWPDGGLETLKSLVASHPHSALAELHLGYAYLWSGRNADAVLAWRQAVKVDPDSSAAVSAGDFVLSRIRSRPPVHRHDDPAAQGSRLAAAAAGADARSRAPPRAPMPNAKVLYGVALWHLQRPLSAERQFQAAAALAPNDPMARTAAAVGAFSKARPVLAFSKLGPLTGQFPRSALVRFHLGVLLLWSREVAKAREAACAHGEARTGLALRSAGKKTAYSPCSHWDQEWKMMSRTAHGATSDPHGTVRHPKKACTTWYSTTRVVGMTQVGGASECSRG